MSAPLATALATSPQVDVVVPVYNEEAALEHGIRRLHQFLSTAFPFGWRIVIADNASTTSRTSSTSSPWTAAAADGGGACFTVRLPAPALSEA